MFAGKMIMILKQNKCIYYYEIETSLLYKIWTYRKRYSFFLILDSKYFEDEICKSDYIKYWIGE